MWPVLYEGNVAGVAVRLDAYATMLAVGALAGLALALLLARRAGLDARRCAAVLGAALISIPIGARVMYALTFPSVYAERPTDAFAPTLVGFGLYGGLGAAVVVGAVAARLLRVDLWRLADASAPGIGIGIAFARVGCFSDGCCFGVVSNGPLSVLYPIGSQAHAAQMMEGAAGILGPVAPVIATQALEGAGALVLGAFALVYARRAKPGVAFLLFAAGFSVVRLVVRQWRWIEPSYSAPEWFYPVVYLGSAGLCVALAFAIARSTTRVVAARDSASASLRSTRSSGQSIGERS